MPERPKNVTEAELAVLKQLWSEGPSTIRQLTDLLYPEGGVAQYGTVQKLLERLEGKSCVLRTQRDRVNVYSPAVERAELIARRLRQTADQLCDGSLTPLFANLVRAKPLSPAELSELRRLVESLKKQAKTRGKRR